jgi:hypothetical protein
MQRAQHEIRPGPRLDDDDLGQWTVSYRWTKTEPWLAICLDRIFQEVQFSYGP